MRFLRRLLIILRLRKERLPIEELQEIELVYEFDGVEMSVTLHCTCQNPAIIAKIDDAYFPALPHFFCPHCDRVCEYKNCVDCRVYNKMTDARLATAEE